MYPVAAQYRLLERLAVLRQRRTLLHLIQSGCTAAYGEAIQKIAKGEESEPWFELGEDLYHLAESIEDGESL